MDNEQISFEIDCESICKKVETYIQEFVKSSKTKGVVVGLSGGIDSAVATALAVRALGKRNVLALILPNAKLDPAYEKDARKLATQLGLEVKKIPISDLVDSFKTSVGEELSKERLVIGNAMARFRMILLYAYSNYMNYLVLGTSNKTEILVGYVTKSDLLEKLNEISYQNRRLMFLTAFVVIQFIIITLLILAYINK